MKYKKGITQKNDVIVKCGADKLLPPALIFGLYVILFGTVSPGGGFQGGVIVSSAALLLYLGYGYDTASKAINGNVLRVGESTGAVLYVVLGLIGIFAGGMFCRNIFFNMAPVGEMVSGGTISFMSYAVGFKVLCGVGFLLLLLLGILAPDNDKEEKK